MSCTFQLMHKVVRDALSYASKMGFKSIALPAMGTGNLHFPRDVAAEIMFNSVIEFSRANPTTSVKDVRFVLYDQNQSTIDVSYNMYFNTIFLFTARIREGY